MHMLEHRIYCMRTKFVTVMVCQDHKVRDTERRKYAIRKSPEDYFYVEQAPEEVLDVTTRTRPFLFFQLPQPPRHRSQFTHLTDPPGQHRIILQVSYAMPRGIPNVKRDESQGMRYTTFHVPPQYVPIIHTMNPISKLYPQTQPEAHEHVVSQVGE
jgi:hypothetical protein